MILWNSIVSLWERFVIDIVTQCISVCDIKWFDLTYRMSNMNYADPAGPTASLFPRRLGLWPRSHFHQLSPVLRRLLHNGHVFYIYSFQRHSRYFSTEQITCSSLQL